MDVLTHSLVGLTAAKAGLGRFSPFATAVCIVAANSPDSDAVVGLFADRWTLLKHHRGITHSIIGVIALGVLIPLIFYLVERVWARWRKRQPRIRLRGFLLVSLIMAASHPLMDWTNNYGVRPLLPWDGRWFYGDLVFIVDPYIWLVVGGAAFLLTSNHRAKIAAWILLAAVVLLITFSPTAQRASAGISLWPIRLTWIVGLLVLIVMRWFKINERLGSKLALAALGFVVVYWGGLAVAQHYAYQEAVANANLIAQPANETVIKVAAMPTLGDPGRWLCVAETDQAMYRYFVKLGQPFSLDEPTWPSNDPYRVPSKPALERFAKPAGPAETLVERASGDRRAQI
ncbi:MAG TPA: metal-dependent hydrolase, partial [Pyrinomonadaceae bacterium]|nr:metal-dependent hydrolase [Pyrinomonadaceae bacterium]